MIRKIDFNVLKLCILFVAVLAAADAFALMVKPMRVELSARPGDSIRIPIEINGNGEAPIVVEAHDLFQNGDGGFVAIGSSSDIDRSKLSSALQWITLDKTSFTASVAEPATVYVGLKIPQSVSGHYFAAVSFTTDAPVQTKNLALKFRLLVPIIIEIIGVPARQNVKLQDMSLAVAEKQKDRPTTTLAVVNLENAGRTYSQVAGSLLLKAKSERGWAQITKVGLKAIGIIPGVNLAIPVDLLRKLPKGAYRLSANLTIDGRRIKPLEKEFEFEGDGEAGALRPDTALLAEPAELRIKTMPGSVRTAVLSVRNSSPETVRVVATPTIPPSLKGMMMGSRKSEELAAEKWLSLSPESFTLGPEGKQNIQVVAKVPAEADGIANFYSMIKLDGFFTDGQPAGTVENMTIITNPKVKVDSKLQILKLNLSKGEEQGRYVASAKAVNLGNVEVIPKARVRVTDVVGKVLADSQLGGEEGAMLPMMFRDYSGELDLTRLADGEYVLALLLDVGEKTSTAKKVGLKVSKDGVTVADEDGSDAEK